MIKQISLASLAVLLAGCSSFSIFDKDNTPDPKPLTEFTPAFKPQRLWSVGVGSGSGDEYLKMKPALDETSIYTASANGVITSVDKFSGQRHWQINTKTQLTTGPAVGDGIVVAGSLYGDVVALRKSDGALAWKTSVPGEILGKPAVSHNIVIVKAVDGHTTALSANDGHTIWSYQQVEPNLVLRASSAPVIQDGNVFVGYANGNLAKINLHDGQTDWMQSVAVPEGAFAIQRMIDIDADPVIYNHHVYAATYQGKIAELGWNSGEILWSHQISSYTGMAAASNAIYVSDAQSHVWGFNAATGDVNWRQNDLEYRIVSGPALMGNYIVVGDGEGYIHWLNRQTGQIAAREHPGGAIYAAPLVENNIVYALTSNGNLYAYQVR